MTHLAGSETFICCPQNRQSRNGSLAGIIKSIILMLAVIEYIQEGVAGNQVD